MNEPTTTLRMDRRPSAAAAPLSPKVPRPILCPVKVKAGCMCLLLYVDGFSGEVGVRPAGGFFIIFSFENASVFDGMPQTSHMWRNIRCSNGTASSFLLAIVYSIRSSRQQYMYPCRIFFSLLTRAAAQSACLVWSINRLAVARRRPAQQRRIAHTSKQGAGRLCMHACIAKAWPCRLRRRKPD